MATRSVSPGQPDTIPALPAYTAWGKLQPPEFSKGALAAWKLIATVEGAKPDDTFDDVNGITERLATEIAKLVGKDPTLGAGAIAALCDYIVTSIKFDGGSNLECTVPFSRAGWTGESLEIPPDDCLFFDVDGIPYSVEPSLSCCEWRGEDDGTSRPVDEIRGRAKPITRTEFEAMRSKLGALRRRVRKSLFPREPGHA